MDQIFHSYLLPADPPRQMSLLLQELLALLPAMCLEYATKFGLQKVFSPGQSPRNLTLLQCIDVPVQGILFDAISDMSDQFFRTYTELERIARITNRK